MAGIPKNLPTTAIMVGLASGIAVGFALFFQLSITATATYGRTLNAAYPYLHAISMHTVEGHPFLYYLSNALKTNSETFEGVNVKEILMNFNETFELVNETGDIVLSTGEKNGERAFLAIPPDGKLVMIYDN